MQVRCQRCSWSFNLGRDFLAQAVKEAEEKNLIHYQVECPKCRRGIKVSLKQMKQFAPREQQENNADPS